MEEKEEENIDLIDAYVKGELAGSDLADFEAKRANNPSFDHEVTDYVLIMKEIRASQENAFVDKLKGWENEIEASGEHVKVIPIRRILSMAATLLLLALAGGYLLWNHLGQPDHDALFAQYFQPYDDVISERSTDEGAKEQGMNFYNQSKYREAIPFLEKVIAEHPDDTAVACYLGIAYLADNRLTKARDVFENLGQGSPGLFKEVAEWNLALIHLKMNQEVLLKEELQLIMSKKDHLYAEKAEELYKQL
jgi:tetratricopeptide (TPR) repeat protein